MKPSLSAPVVGVMIFSHIIKSVLLVLLFLLTAVPAFAADGAREKESVFDRVIRTGTIRCGYFSWYPAIIKDPNTGEMKGIFYDFMQEVGKILSLKVEFTEEIGLSDYPVALENGRIDAMCGANWLIAQRARVIDFVAPLYYLPLYGFSREGDTRFDQDVFLLNDPQYKMAVLEGGATETIRRMLFPDAIPVELPQLVSPSELFVTLSLGKADAIIYDMFTFGDFEKHNPGKVRRISDAPLKAYPNILAIKRGEDEFKSMLTHAYTDLLLSGTLDRIIDRHEVYKGAIMRVALPYDPAR